jgi:hypothetical protein
MMFTDAEESQAYLVRQDSLFDNVANDASVGAGRAIIRHGDIPESIQTKFPFHRHANLFLLLLRLDSSATI